MSVSFDYIEDDEGRKRQFSTKETAVAAGQSRRLIKQGFSGLDGQALTVRGNSTKMYNRKIQQHKTS